MLQQFIARQLGNPSHGVGQVVLAPLWNRRNSSLNNRAFTELTVQPDDRILEIGFGGGYLLRLMLEQISSGLVAGIDISPAMVSYCTVRSYRTVRAGQVKLLHGAAENLPFLDNSFTKVCSVNSIFYWHDANRVFQEVIRVLSPQGLLVLCFTERQSLATRDFSRYGLKLYESEAVARLLESVGFSIRNLERSQDRHRQYWIIKAEKSAGTS